MADPALLETRRQLREATAALHQLQASVGRERRRQAAFVSTLAHELRQPLAAVLAAVEVARLAPGSPAAGRAADVVRRQIAQMSRVVQDLFEAARWAQGKVTMQKQRVDLRDVIRDAALDVAGAAAERGHELRVPDGSDPLWADADPQRLQQVLSNLLRNAVKFTNPGGCISLTADRTASTVTLRVSDTGRGIEVDALPHIFELFSQVAPEEGVGLGVGLSVAREIVARHDGQIEARSGGPGQGSEFIVTLPLAPAPESAQVSG